MGITKLLGITNKADFEKTVALPQTLLGLFLLVAG
jgi:hypothetical protein